MAEKEIFVFADPTVVPTEELIFSFIGDKSRLWHGVMNHMQENYQDISLLWRYYNDGKQWFCRLLQKKKTVFWIAVLKDTFRITFYFGDKAEPLIENSDLPEQIKRDFKSAKRYGKIRGISIKMADEKDVDKVQKLMALKVQASKY